MRSCICGIVCASRVAVAVHRVQSVHRVPSSDDWMHEPRVQVPADDPDALYRDRENLAEREEGGRASGRRGSRPNPKDFDVGLEAGAGRATGSAPTACRSPSARPRSRPASPPRERRSRIDASKPEGHFWLAANMGALAESFGLRQGIKYRGQIRDALETTLKLDPAFLQGSADRALGRWYFKVPGLFGGSNKKSEEHLRKSLTYNPQQRHLAHLPGRDARRHGPQGRGAQGMQAAIDAPLDPDWTPEDRRFKEQAKQLLQD